MIGKLEETHEATRSIRRFMSANYAKISTIVLLAKAPELARPVCEIDQQTSESADFEHLAMLVDIYCPTLRPQLQLLNDARDEYSKAATNIAARVLDLPNMDSPSRGSLQERLQAAHDRVLQTVKTIQEGVSMLARKLL
jgi:hypothetical protein